MIALLIGALLAVGALAFVLRPLFGDSGERSPDAARPDESPAPSESARAVEALRDVEFDRAAGRLSDADYATLKAEYTREAIAAMRAEQVDASGASLPEDDVVEALILRYRARPRSCAHCGPRPEPNAIYCSDCGRYLDGRCSNCGASVDDPGARVCAACGHTLAA